jgi:hypothetical protein
VNQKKPGYIRAFFVPNLPIDESISQIYTPENYLPLLPYSYNDAFIERRPK